MAGVKRGPIWAPSLGPTELHSISEGYRVTGIPDRLMEKLRHYKLHFVEAKLIKGAWRRANFGDCRTSQLTSHSGFITNDVSGSCCPRITQGDGLTGGCEITACQAERAASTQLWMVIKPMSQYLVEV